MTLNSRKYLIGLIGMIFLSLCIFNTSAVAMTYHVDFAGGSDTNDGRTISTPFKHCPGDLKATDTAASTTLSPGDTVNFKGGVKYRGQITLSWSGTSGNPITYKGNPEGWGVGKAIIVGSEAISTQWTKCSSAGDCWNNPNWSNIWYTAIPSGYTFVNRLYQDNRYVNISQAPNPKDPLFMWSVGEWLKVPVGNMTQTAVKDSTFFTQLDPNYWTGAQLMGWYTGNSTKTKTITSYNPATNTITHDTVAPAYPYTDRTNLYSVINHPALIDAPGEYAYRPSQNRLYLWAYGNSNPNTVSIDAAVRSDIFTGANKSYITLDGFKLTQSTGSTTTDDQGNAVEVRASNGTVTGIRVINNEVYYLSGWNEPDAIHIYASGGGVVSVENNHVHDNFKNRGIFVGSGGPGSSVANNIIARTGHTGMWINEGNGYSVSGNTISEVKGAHGNGMAVYLSSNMILEKNKISDANPLLAFETGSNLTVINNIFDGYGYGTINEWGGMSGYVRFTNNTILNGGRNVLRFASGPTHYVINNVIDGGGIGDIHEYNVYVGLNYLQEGPTYPTRYGWNFGTGEIYVSDLTKLFVNPSVRDYTPLPGGPLVGKGINGSDIGSSGIISGSTGSTTSTGAGVPNPPMNIILK